MSDVNRIPEKPGKERAVQSANEAESAARAIGDVTRRVVEKVQAPAAEGPGDKPSVDPVAESFEHGRRAIETAADVVGAYREGADGAAADLQMLRACSSELMRGTHRLQQAWLEAMRQSYDQIGRTPENMLRCGSALELAQAQRDLYAEMARTMVASTATMLQAMADVSQEALRTLQQTPRRG